jgi:hypothetical protein
MFTILGSLLGFAGSAVPSLIDYFKNKSDKEQKTEEFKLQLEAKKLGVDLDIKLFDAKKDFEEHKMLLDHDTALGNQKGFINSLRAFVRPFITYIFFLTFIGVKITLLYQAIQNGSDLNTTLGVVWDEQTEALFATIISFWFGSRVMPSVKKSGTR